MNSFLFFVLVSIFGLSFVQSVEAKKVDFFEKSSLYYFDGVYVLDLHGTREEMMFAHGYFAAKNVKALSPIDYFSAVMDKQLNDKFGGLGPSVLGTSVGALLKRRMNDEDEKAFKAFAMGYGQSSEKILKALYYPDFGEMLAAVMYGKNKTVSDIPDLGCSTFVVPKSNTNPGMLFARNLEFGGVGSFDRYPAVVYLNSTDTKDQPYIQMTALGLPGTHTAYNKSGIMISLHQLTVNQYSPVGDLILNVVDEVARRAHTLEEAKLIINSKKFTTPWKLIVASESQNTGFVAEVTAKGKYYHDMLAAGLGESNHVSERSLKDDEFFTSYNYLQSSIQRKATMMNALNAGKIVDANSATNLLGDRLNPVTGENSFTSLSKFSNIMAVVVSAKDQQVYFGVSHQVDTKPSAGVYIRFPLDFSVNFDTYIPVVHKPSIVYPSELLAVDRNVRAAMSENNQSGDLHLVADYLKKAVSTYGMDADLNNVYAAILLKQYGASGGKSEKFLSQAAAALDRSKGIVRGENQKAVLQILTARIAVLKSNTNDAKKIYQDVVSTTLLMKAAVEDDMKAIRSNKARAVILEKSRKLKVTLSDLDILDF